MPKFRYRAVDSEGRPSEGVLEARSSTQVVALLREQGLQVNDVRPLTAPTRRRMGVSWSDLHLFNEQLQGLVRSGLPLPDGLAAMAQDLQNRRLQAAIEDMRSHVEAGHSLESAFARHEGVFPAMYQTMIRAGERSGNLSEVLEALTEWSERMVTRRHALQVAVAYPLFVVIGALAVLTFMLLAVVPSFEKMFWQFGGALPWPTQLVIGMSNALRGDSPVALVIMAAVVGGALACIAAVFIRGHRSLFWERCLWRLPLLGRVYRSETAARFSRTAAALLRSGVSAPEALRLAGDAADSAVLARAAGQAAQAVEAGTGLGPALAGTGAFSHTFCWMLGMGEKSGELVTVLANLAEMEDRHADTRAKLALALLGPTMIVITGIAIAFVIISLYMPIFTLGDAIAG